MKKTNQSVQTKTSLLDKAKELKIMLKKIGLMKLTSDRGIKKLLQDLEKNPKKALKRLEGMHDRLENALSQSKK